MDIALWILAGLLAAAFLASGSAKLLKSRASLIEGGYGWAEDFSDGQVKGIGVLEVLGAVGLIVPAAFGSGGIITPIAATCLSLLVVSAAVVHVRRGEARIALNPLVLGVPAAALAVCRFGPFPF